MSRGEWIGGVFLGTDPGVSDSFLLVVRSAIMRIPEPTRVAIADAGCYVWATRRITEKYPWMNDAYPPTAYPDGATWDAVSAFWYRECKCAIMAEEYRDGGRWHGDAEFYPWPLLHELGHGVDYEFGQPSRSKGFRAAYFADRAAALDEHPAECAAPHQLRTFVWSCLAGSRETFAESCAAVWNPNGSRPEMSFRAAFPRCISWAATYLAQLGQSAQVAA